MRNMDLRDFASHVSCNNPTYFVRFPSFRTFRREPKRHFAFVFCAQCTRLSCQMQCGFVFKLFAHFAPAILTGTMRILIARNEHSSSQVVTERCSFR